MFGLKRKVATTTATLHWFGIVSLWLLNGNKNQKTCVGDEKSTHFFYLVFLMWISEFVRSVCLCVYKWKPKEKSLNTSCACEKYNSKEEIKKNIENNKGKASINDFRCLFYSIQSMHLFSSSIFGLSFFRLFLCLECSYFGYCTFIFVSSHGNFWEMRTVFIWWPLFFLCRHKQMATKWKHR